MSFEPFPAPQSKIETEYDNFIKERNELYKSPEAIKPGTARMLSHSLQKTIEINEKSMDKEAEENGTGVHDKRKNEMNQSMKTQRLILDQELLGSNTSDEIFKEMIEKGEEINPELVKQKREDFSANKMFDVIQKRVDYLEELKNNGDTNIKLFDFNQNIDTLLKQTGDLQQRLLSEASKDSEK